MNKRFFMMSRRFNKNSPEDFGLLPGEDIDTFIIPADNSLWRRRELYDLGWGKESGYFRLPLPDFNDLVEIVLYSKSEDDRYGAASVILDDYPEELLSKCEAVFKDKRTAKSYYEFFRILGLVSPINHSPILEKDYSKINDDYERWKEIADKIRKIQ